MGPSKRNDGTGLQQNATQVSTLLLSRDFALQKRKGRATGCALRGAALNGSIMHHPTYTTLGGSGGGLIKMS